MLIIKDSPLFHDISCLYLTSSFPNGGGGGGGGSNCLSV